MTAPDPRLDEIQARLSAVKEGPWELFSFGATDVRYLLAELRKAHEALAQVEALCEQTDVESGEPLQAWLVDSIRAAVAAAKGDERG